jgi:hypothetical protein
VTAAAVHVVESWIPRPESHREWPELSVHAPQLTATMRRYLLQLTTFLAPRSVDVADSTLRQLARWLVTNTEVAVVADISRRHIEDYKVWLAARPGSRGPTLATNTQRQRLRMIRIFLERLIEWDWPDAPAATRSCTATSRPAPNRCPSSSPTPTPPSSWPPPEHTICRATGSWPRCSPAPACAPPNSASSPPTLSPRSATPTGSACRSASSATTGSSPCTPTSSSCSASGPPPTRSTSALRAGSSPTVTSPSTGGPCTASWLASASTPASDPSTPTSSDTPWPPKPSTAGCASKPSPPCSVIMRVK